jgi:hypothetical protein
MLLLRLEQRRNRAAREGHMEQQQTSSAVGRKPWAAYNIVERGEKHFWNRVGSAFKNRDGSYNIYLDALPRDGKIQIREIRDDDREQRKERGELAQAAQATVEA